MYITNWDDYLKAVTDLYELHPNQIRYVANYRHSVGELVLKVTNDRKRAAVMGRIGSVEFSKERIRINPPTLYISILPSFTTCYSFKCLKYRTKYLPDLKKFERLNRILLSKMQNKSKTVEEEDAQPHPSTTPATAGTGGDKIGAKAGGVKKKKGKKGKGK
ncbi:hypothetical protein BKA69DRAFT_1037212 [Paraphysoderma sedebokerense]|nr:hypothetical protein BKA69DRAFT_1037212 [Paraphysoderma sedebokerense]